MRKLLFIIPCLAFFFNCFSVSAQSNNLDPYLQIIAQEEQLTADDISDYVITSSHTSKRSNITHYYLRQSINQIEIFETQSSIHILEDGSLFKYNNAFIPNRDQKVTSNTTALSHQDAIQKAIDNFGYDGSAFPAELETNDNTEKKKIFSGGSISQVSIPIRLMYYLNSNDELRLCYDFSIHEVDHTDWWSLKIDANTGELISQINWIVECNFDHDKTGKHICNDNAVCKNYSNKSSSVNPDSYNVYAAPTESPNHGNRTLVADPADLTASPFGWHDTNGVAGAESNLTVGNNVNAQEDLNGNNGNGYSPDGGSSLDFDFPIDFTMAPSVNIDASLTNLFYWNNIIHDVFYQYGFDEASGNFQENNYGNGGNSSDGVLADGLDGSGTNNANFSTPPDGSNPRMQMFLWSPGVSSSTTINSPAEIEAPITGITANYGPSNFDITNEVVLADDGTANPNEACNTIVNASDINGKIALIDRGTCEFSAKAINAQTAGAIAVIICQNTNDSPFAMNGGTNGGSVTIPNIMISQQECDSIKAYLPDVNITMTSADTGVEVDGSFDNGIIAHEYGHGISIRLTGGSSNSACLSNTEQMGEGWSDWFGMVMTIEPGDISTDRRGVGTYAIVEPVTGGGIRDYPYSTDLNIDPRTYNDIKTASVPHGVGSVWCAMLWEMTWALIDVYGFDPDLYNGTGGNNIALALVTEGLKLQPCSPGFVSGRDAIIAADQALYGGQNNCLIWAAFAKRGLGDGASQGSTGSSTDGTESFVSPTSCEILDVTKSVDKTIVTAGDTLTYTLKFDNQTSATYTNLIILDTLLDCLTYITGSVTGGATFTNGVIELTIPTVDPFTTHEVTFQALAEPNILFLGQTFLEDVENGANNWKTESKDITMPTWEIDNSNPFAGTFSWFAENTGQQNTRYLTLKSPKKITAASELKFWHTYSSLPNVDGGKVEISIDNKATWLDIDTYFTQNGYDNFIQNDPTNLAFGGTNNTTYVETIADLSSFANEYAFIRFTMFNRGSTEGIGWNIDNIEITSIEKTIDNIGYFTASPSFDQIINVFPPVNIIPATCSDGIQNGNETAIDAGGTCSTGGPCDFDLTLSGDPAATGTYQAQNQITSTANVGPNTNYFASCILLENDFEVVIGNEFLAEINPCSTFSNDNEVALKIISTSQSAEQNTSLVDVNIPIAGEYILQLEIENKKLINLPTQYFEKGVHRVSVETKKEVVPNKINVIRK